MGSEDDIDGKRLYGVLLNEIKSMRKDREDLAEVVVRYVTDNCKEEIDELYEDTDNSIEG